VLPPRAFIIHGYHSFPEEAWLPWLKAELERRGYEAFLPAMPHPDRPTIPEWIGVIAKLVGEPDDQTVLVGHSLGVQAVLRYVETLGQAGKSVGKTVLVAGNFPTGMSAAEADERTGGDAVLRPWLTGGVDPKKVQVAMGKCTVILSDDDPYIPCERAKASFAGNLDAKIIVEKGKGHFNEDDQLTELPSVLSAVLA
jgi:predicted alpha/beta hydrolase family esterase